ncbi:MAG: hypothetical protein E6485_09600 [Haemophilus parainfluenzae]|jgi:hypothetical protein|nr:hypothetical protein [Haemophilus parainfluenzae]DAK68788.1 MAG TPA: hypothetical protein [Caudoviricetes sp.]DAM74116.1 MAG TPA: hypothetical protein [Caudoviricetes sp.]
MIKKYIIVASEDINAALQDKITNYFQEKEMNIWHWITNVWLLIDDSGVSRNQIRDDLLKFVKSGPLLIFEVSDPAQCTGFTSPKQAKWILDNWINDEPVF